jgi:hypothetical protein
LLSNNWFCLRFSKHVCGFSTKANTTNTKVATDVLILMLGLFLVLLLYFLVGVSTAECAPTYCLLELMFSLEAWFGLESWLEHTAPEDWAKAQGIAYRPAGIHHMLYTQIYVYTYDGSTSGSIISISIIGSLSIIGGISGSIRGSGSISGSIRIPRCKAVYAKVKEQVQF